MTESIAAQRATDGQDLAIATNKTNIQNVYNQINDPAIGVLTQIGTRTIANYTLWYHVKRQEDLLILDNGGVFNVMFTPSSGVKARSDAMYTDLYTVTTGIRDRSTIMYDKIYTATTGLDAISSLHTTSLNDINNTIGTRDFYVQNYSIWYWLNNLVGDLYGATYDMKNRSGTMYSKIYTATTGLDALSISQATTISSHTTSIANKIDASCFSHTVIPGNAFVCYSGNSSMQRVAYKSMSIAGNYDANSAGFYPMGTARYDMLVTNVTLCAGHYSVIIYCARFTDKAIVKLYIDGTNTTKSADMYGTFSSLDALMTNVDILTTANHEIVLWLDSKNASSSDYAIMLKAVEFGRTGDL